MSLFQTLSFVKSFLQIQGANIKECVRFASKKARASTSNTNTTVKPKHRGIKKPESTFVTKGTILARQRTLRWLPGLNVGIGREGSLYAKHHGQMVITCEKFDANWNKKWVKEKYGGRENQLIYKKYINVIPPPQHTRFKLIDQI